MSKTKDPIQLAESYLEDMAYSHFDNLKTVYALESIAASLVAIARMLEKLEVKT